MPCQFCEPTNSEKIVQWIVAADFKFRLTVKNMEKSTTKLVQKYPEKWVYWNQNWLNRPLKDIYADRENWPKDMQLAFLLQGEPEAICIYICPMNNSFGDILFNNC